MRARAIVLVGLLAASLGVPTSGASASIPRLLFFGPSLTEDKPLNEADIAQLAGSSRESSARPTTRSSV